MSYITRTRNIVLLTDCLDNLEAGAEKQIFELAKRLDKEQFKIFVVSLQADPHLKPVFENIGCRWQVFPVKRIYSPSGLLQGFRFARFLKKEKIDILQTYHFGSDIWGTCFAHWAGVRAIISNRRDMGFWRTDKHVKAYQFINRWVDKIVVVAEAVRDVVAQQEHIPADKLLTIYNGVEISSQESGRSVESMKADLGVAADENSIIHVANLRPVKGHVYLLRALAQLVGEWPKVKLVLIGEDTMNGELQKLAEELKIKNHVIFAGKRADARELLQTADICVLPSLSEGMSNALLEYMAAGKPVVATRVGGNSELITDGFNGVLVNKENVSELKSALLTLLKDWRIRQVMGKNGLHRVQTEFSMEAMVSKYSALFSSLVPVQQKILHLISSGGMYGAENVVLSLSRQFNQKGMLTVVAALDDQRNSHLEILQRAKKEGLETLTVPSRGRFDFRPVIQLKQYLKKNRIVLVHTHNYKSNLLGLVAARWAGVPTVATAHGFTDMSRSVKFYERLDRFVLSRFFKRVVTVTENVLPQLSASRKRVIRNGLNLESFAHQAQQRKIIRQSFQISADAVVVGTVGRLSPEKNQAMLIEAVHNIIHKFENAKFIIVGDGVEREALQQKVKKFNLSDRIFFAGFTDDVVSFYSAMDIFVLTSKTEGVPLTLLEAMASRLPVIATKVGGIPEIIQDNRTGFLVSPHDISDFSRKLEYLMANPQVWPTYGNAGYEYVKSHYSQEAMIENYKRVYEEAVR